MNHIKQMCVLILFLMVSGNVFAGYDYSDAMGYQATRHRTGQWQQLGTIWTAESAPRVPMDNSDDGVSWSTDGGSTFGHGDLTAGQSVTFRFDMWRSTTGTHKYDQIKAWIDWDGNKVWDNTSEQIIAKQWFKNVDPGVQNKSFFATVTVPELAAAEIWLRARVTCDHVSFANTNPYGNLWQGEVEDYKVNVSAVPAPSAFMLLGSGLVGFRRLRRRFSA